MVGRYRTFLGKRWWPLCMYLSGERSPDAMQPDRYCLLCDTQLAYRHTRVSSQRPARGGWWWVRLLCHPEGVGTVRVTNPSLHHTCSLPASQNTNVRITNLCSAGFAESVVTPRDMYVYSAQRLPCRHVTLAVTRTCTLLFCLQPLRPAARPSRGQDPAVPISVACCRTRNARQVCVYITRQYILLKHGHSVGCVR